MNAISLCILCFAPSVAVDPGPGDALLDAYFQAEVRRTEETTRARLRRAGERWDEERDALRRELFEMLGLDPLPPRDELREVVTGTIHRADLGIVVEKLHFQSVRGLYVTANLYRPATFEGKLPAILYLCGHGRVASGGVSYGNKVYYQHHPAWFARQGYVCLVIDSLQLGEIEGLHHGTYRDVAWWWVSRGYTPAGIEAWNSIRAIDYLQSRPEVDGSRIGVTGRSGGGIGTWWLAALDDRPAVLAPVAGITDLRNHVLDGCIEGHCDCNFFINWHRWDYPLVAALAAPRPLLFLNSDRDTIFPLDGVLRIRAALDTLYAKLGRSEAFGLTITYGPHADTQDLRIPAFRWNERWLRGRPDGQVPVVAEKMFEPAELRVFSELPADERNTSIQDVFVPAAAEPALPASREECDVLRESWARRLAETTFRTMPAGGRDPVAASRSVCAEGLRLVELRLDIEPGVELPLWLVRSDASEAPVEAVDLRVLDDASWTELSRRLAGPFPDVFPVPPDADALEAWRLANILEDGSAAIAFLAPRGVGPTRWSGDDRKRNQIRRRFLVLGRTLAQTRIFDVRRAITALGSWATTANARLSISAKGDSALIAAHAAAMEPRVGSLRLEDCPATYPDSVELLGVRRVLDVPQALSLFLPRPATVTVRAVDASRFEWTRAASALYGAPWVIGP